MPKLLSRLRKLGLLIAGALALTVTQPGLTAFAAAGETVRVAEQAADIRVIPDKYNTGPKGTLTKFKGEIENTVQNISSITGKQGSKDVKILLKKSSAENTFNIRFATDNGGISGEVHFDDMDLSGFRFDAYEEENLDHDVTFVFNNCKMNWIKKSTKDSRVLYKFNNCKIRRFEGSNAVFNRCAFGGSFDDPLMPVRNVEVYDCYFSDLNYATSSGTHIDGTQIFGEYGNDVKDLVYRNCRFEIPYIRLENSKATVNACLMLALERSNAYNVTVEDCVMNGGGTYTIYAAPKASTGDWKYENISIKNIKIGAARLGSGLCPALDKNVEFKNICGTDSLYVASVIKENGTTKFSVTNDTGSMRKLRIVTDKGVFDNNIKAGPTGETLENGTFKAFSDIPADRLIDIKTDCGYAVCLDITDPNNIKQIRFVNYTGNAVSIDKSYFGTDEAQSSNILRKGTFEGTKGEQLRYTITKDYVLTISGSGAMKNFGTIKDADGNTIVLYPPWNDYKYFIKKIVVKEGITVVSLAAFKDHFAVEAAVLENGVTTISSGAFRNCSILSDLTVPKTLTYVHDYAFAGTAKEEELLQKARAAATAGDEPAVKKGDVNNDNAVDSQDLSLMQQSLAGWNVQLNENIADVTGDGKFTGEDISLMQQHIAGWSVTFK